MKYTTSDVKQWAIVFLEENNFFMAHEASKILLYTPPGDDIANDLVVQTVYTEYLKIMNKRPCTVVKNDHEETITLAVRIKDNLIIDAYIVEDEHAE